MTHTSEDTVVSGLGLVAVAVHKRRTLTREGGRNPRVLVGETPESNTSTLWHVETSKNSVLVVSFLLSQSSAGGGSVGTNVQFRDGNFNAQSSEALNVVLEVGRNLTDDHVRLETNTVDGDAGSKEPVHQVVKSCGLAVDGIGVVVVARGDVC